MGLAVSVLVAAFILSGMRALAGLAMLAMAVSAVQTVPALLEYFSYGGGPAAYAALFLAGQAAQLGLLACLFFLPGAKLYFSVCGRNGKNAEQLQNPARICKRNRVRLFLSYSEVAANRYGIAGEESTVKRSVCIVVLQAKRRMDFCV